VTQFVPATPTQGALYHRLTTVIAASHSGLGPQNVSSASYAPMTGRAFQKPLSGSTTAVPTVPGHLYR
jgi:hypothetical protein